MPWKYCAMMAPELPRAPSRAASAISSSNPGMPPRVPPRSRLPTLFKVNIRLVPVSPSGTGNTLMRLSSSRRVCTWVMPAISAAWNCSGSIRSNAEEDVIAPRLPGRAWQTPSIAACQFLNLRGGERPRQLFAGLVVANHRHLISVALNQLEVIVDIDDLDAIGQPAFDDQPQGLVAELARLSRVEQ